MAGLEAKRCTVKSHIILSFQHRPRSYVQYCSLPGCGWVIGCRGNQRLCRLEEETVSGSIPGIFQDLNMTLLKLQIAGQFQYFVYLLKLQEYLCFSSGANIATISGPHACYSSLVPQVNYSSQVNEAPC